MIDDSEKEKKSHLTYWRINSDNGTKGFNGICFNS